MSLINMKKKSLYFSVLIFTIFIILSTMSVIGAEKDVQVKPKVQTVEVVLQTHYLDGEVSEEIVLEEIWSMEDFWSFYGDWQLVDQNEKRVIFKKELNDISPLLKVNGYFGLSEDGTLNIYNGKPEQNEVIQSFFQVNTSRLKSHLHEKLKEGIPISTKDNYFDVLKMCEQYAIQEL